MLVFDSSTLILTAKIELLDLLLREIGMEVAIPRTVEEECCGAKKTFDAFMIQKALDESRIIIRGVRNKKLVLRLKVDFSMGQGESEAIALALQEKARLVGVDDSKAADLHPRRKLPRDDFRAGSRGAEGQGRPCGRADSCRQNTTNPGEWVCCHRIATIFWRSRGSFPKRSGCHT
jgi:predicted nucleic acid-binding protein